MHKYHNWVLRRIFFTQEGGGNRGKEDFSPKREVATGGRRKTT
jgi:hypothetical protein